MQKTGFNSRWSRSYKILFSKNSKSWSSLETHNNYFFRQLWNLMSIMTYMQWMTSPIFLFRTQFLEYSQPRNPRSNCSYSWFRSYNKPENVILMVQFFYDGRVKLSTLSVVETITGVITKFKELKNVSYPENRVWNPNIHFRTKTRLSFCILIVFAHWIAHYVSLTLIISEHKFKFSSKNSAILKYYSQMYLFSLSYTSHLAH